MSFCSLALTITTKSNVVNIRPQIDELDCLVPLFYLFSPPPMLFLLLFSLSLPYPLCTTLVMAVSIWQLRIVNYQRVVLSLCIA